MITQASVDTTEAALAVGGMDCASCVAHVEKAVKGLAGVEACQVNLARGRAVVRFDAGRVSEEQIAQAITESGYPSTPENLGGSAANVEEQRINQQRAHAAPGSGGRPSAWRFGGPWN